jgi:hypothetical protein
MLTEAGERLCGAIKRPNSTIGVPESWIAEIEKEAIQKFVAKMSADYRRHNAVAVREDMVSACADFGVDPESFYDLPEEALELKADVAHYKIMKGLS